MDNLSFDPEKIHIKEYKVLNIELSNSLDVFSATLDFEHIVGYNVAVNYDNALIKTEIEITITATIPGKESPKCHLKVAYIFDVAELKELITPLEGEKFNVSDDVLQSITVISYSTTRGILLSKTQGSYFDKFILPVLNVHALLDKFLPRPTPDEK